MASSLKKEDVLGEETPFAITPIVGYRVWNVYGQYRSPRLESITLFTLWPFWKPLQAYCYDHWLHSPPDSRHKCGIYALKSEEDARRWLDRPGRVLGLVALWGRVLLYERGYIAQYAYPLALTRCGSGITDDIAKKLARNYGLDLLL
ncbi:MAG: hypothetical protein QXI19_07565 [Candidatus Caldarchaeum sp.]